MKTEDLQNKSYDELVQLCQDGNITWVEFVEAQQELTEDWQEWIKKNPVNDQSAKDFLTDYESRLMNT
ncbi:hypothetical protein [Bacteroides heparinolyticus]|uniref:hypothetical protein n=1 Tax=Prevotella heparinolytica TaxID=28113 RepID=UPI0035A078EC